MAEKRMFAKTIIDSDAFLEMPQSSQLLYFHLSMRADDDGFINKPKSIMIMVRCNDDDMRILISKKFIIPFESGIVVIKHWKIHNYIAADRYSETKYKDEKSRLLLDENKAYKMIGNPLYTDCIQVVDGMDTQVRLDKISIDIDKENIVQEDCTVSKKDIESLFETMWKIYPNKKGKGQISDSKKKKLYEVGFDKISIAIQRYQTELAKDNKEKEWRKAQNGSTFFNSGYIDYLDGNYSPGVIHPQPKSNNSFNQYPQRVYSAEDYANLEKNLINKGI